MSGTKLGGLKAAATNKERYGEDFYRKNGIKGGKLGHTGGFAANPKLAKMAGYMGVMARKKRQAKGIEKVIRGGKEVSKILVYKTAGKRPQKVRVNYGR